MKNNKGFTLVELLVVIAIFVMLLSWGIPAYSRWKGKHDAEADLSRLYSQLQFARMTAYTTKTITGVYWGNGGAGFTEYSVRVDSGNDGSIDDEDATSQLAYIKNKYYTITPTQTLSSVSFDGRGFVHSLGRTFSISASTGAPVNCISVAETRTIIGRMIGGTCTPQ